MIFFQSGEMCVKAPLVMKGYHKNPQATADTMTEDGFFKTGDLGHFKPGSGLFITDRIKELIKVNLQIEVFHIQRRLRVLFAAEVECVCFRSKCIYLCMRL